MRQPKQASRSVGGPAVEPHTAFAFHARCCLPLAPGLAPAPCEADSQMWLSLSRAQTAHRSMPRLHHLLPQLPPKPKPASSPPAVLRLGLGGGRGGSAPFHVRLTFLTLGTCNVPSSPQLPHFWNYGCELISATSYTHGCYCLLVLRTWGEFDAGGLRSLRREDRTCVSIRICWILSLFHLSWRAPNSVDSMLSAS